MIRNFQAQVCRPRAELLSSRSQRVFISLEAYQRMLLYVDIAQKEVGWLGTVGQLTANDFLIEQVFLLDQIVGDQETVLSADGLSGLMEEMVVNGGDSGFEKANRLRFWGHSHVHMETHPSVTDERTMGRFCGEGHPWYIRGIFNKQGEANFTIYFYDRGYRVTNLPWMICDPEAKIVFHASRRDQHVQRLCSHWEVADQAALLADAISVNGWQGVDIPLRELLPKEELYCEVFEEFGRKVKERCSARPRQRSVHC